MSSIKCHNIVKRQTENSPFSHFTGSWEQLEKMVEANREKAIGGDKLGSFLTPLPPEGFFTSFVKLTPETKLSVEYKPRLPGEDFYLHIYAEGQKSPAKFVQIVTYSRELLGKDATTDADFEIVSINASPFEDVNVPMDPVTMTRNFLERPGGTKAVYSAGEFAKAIHFHFNGYAMVKPK